MDDSCNCLLTSQGAKGLSELFKEKAADLIEPLKGVHRDSELRDAEALVEAAKDLYKEARSFVKGKPPPFKGGQALSSGTVGTIQGNLEYFDKIADASREDAKRDEPLHRASGTLKQLSEGFDELSGRLAASCVIGKNLL